MWLIQATLRRGLDKQARLTLSASRATACTYYRTSPGRLGVPERLTRRLVRAVAPRPLVTDADAQQPGAAWTDLDASDLDLDKRPWRSRLGQTWTRTSSPTYSMTMSNLGIFRVANRPARPVTW